MDKTLRNQLYNTVVKCRWLLEEDLTQQLEEAYSIRAGGKVEPPDNLPHLDDVGRAKQRPFDT